VEDEDNIDNNVNEKLENIETIIKEGTIIKSRQFVLYEITLSSYNFL
jgi:hypothetical protein